MDQSNKQIGTQLGISTRTVDGAVRLILARLGVRSRVGVARLYGEAVMQIYEAKLPGNSTRSGKQR